jgi:hypothetical protein
VTLGGERRAPLIVKPGVRLVRSGLELNPRTLARHTLSRSADDRSASVVIVSSCTIAFLPEVYERARTEVNENYD